MNKIFKTLAALLLGVLVYFAVATYPKLDLISGFSAKSIASGHFIDGRSIETIEKGDNNIPLLNLATNTVDESGKLALSSVYGLKKRKAIYREGLGATLINADFDIHKPYLIPKRNKSTSTLPFPYGNSEPKDTIFKNVDYRKLQSAINSYFDASDTKGKRTRAVVVLYKKKLIAEQYSTGFSKNSSILGWSMTKSITSSAFGVLVKQGKFDINKPAPIDE